METRIPELLGPVASYYSDKLAEHGETARGVDWNGDESQQLRFHQLAQILRPSSGFSINDLGCGYGALFDYLQARYQDFSYYGYDVSSDMVRAAISRYDGKPQAQFYVAAGPLQLADYGIASGIFNVRLKCNPVEWGKYIEATLDVLNQSSRFGFAFNCLTSYSDQDKVKDHLYYASPSALFDLCMQRYSRYVALLHDYALYEFSILVRKTP